MIGAPLSVVLILGQKVLPLESRQGWLALILFLQSSCLWPSFLQKMQVVLFLLELLPGPELLLEPDLHDCWLLLL